MFIFHECVSKPYISFNSPHHIWICKIQMRSCLIKCFILVLSSFGIEWKQGFLAAQNYVQISVQLQPVSGMNGNQYQSDLIKKVKCFTRFIPKIYWRSVLLRELLCSKLMLRYLLRISENLWFTFSNIISNS